MNAPTTFTNSAVFRVLGMLHRWFRDHGSPPSYRQVERLAAVPLPRVRRYLEQLQRLGVLTFQPGVPYSIEMVDRCANLSDAELERACRGRNWTIIKPPPIAIALGEAFRLSPGITDCEADLIARIDETTRTPGGDVDGSPQDQDQIHGAGEGRAAQG